VKAEAADHCFVVDVADLAVIADGDPLAVDLDCNSLVGCHFGCLVAVGIVEGPPQFVVHLIVDSETETVGLVHNFDWLKNKQLNIQIN
jgi:hypothetical protein